MGNCCNKCNCKPCNCSCGLPRGIFKPCQPDCKYATLPTFVVEKPDNLKTLRIVLVHVKSNNTTYYIDCQGRIVQTWTGTVEQDDYNYVANPLNLRNQWLVDRMNSLVYYYDSRGVYYKSSIKDTRDVIVVEELPQIELAETNTLYVLSSDGSEYFTKDHLTWVRAGGKDLRPATATTLGGIKVGDNLTITDDGTLSASGTAVVNNGKTTLSRNGTPIGSWTANQPADTEINVPVPTKVSELTNDLQFRTKAQVESELLVKMDKPSNIGTTGQVLRKTATGSEWSDSSSLGGAWGSISGTLSDQTDLQLALDAKISNPTGGNVGQVLTKTGSGSGWSNLPIATATTFGTVKIAVSSVDIGEGADLPAGTIYAVIGA